MGRASRRKRDRKAGGNGESPESARFRQEMQGPSRRGVEFRMVGPVLLVGPAFDRRPNYEECIDYLIERHGAEIEAGAARGGRYTFEVRHDDRCPALTEGGCCDCECIVNLVCLVEPRED
jgi:hypothetical protein